MGRRRPLRLLLRLSHLFFPIFHIRPDVIDGLVLPFAALVGGLSFPAHGHKKIPHLRHPPQAALHFFGIR